MTTQAQLLELMTEMVDRFATSLVIVTHNLGVVARHAARIYVMYSGRVVESGPAEEIFEHPRHPYTIGLLNCVPRLGETRRKRKLIPIVGLPPNLIYMPSTCAFLPGAAENGAMYTGAVAFPCCERARPLCCAFPRRVKDAISEDD